MIEHLATAGIPVTRACKVLGVHQQKDYQIRVEAELGPREGWHCLVEFVLHARYVDSACPFITYDNWDEPTI